MSGKFNGFTQEEISKLTTTKSDKAIKKVQALGRGIQRVPDKKSVQPAETNIKRAQANKMGSVPKVAKPPEDQLPKLPPQIIDSDLDSTSMQGVLHFQPLSAKQVSNTEQQRLVDESILHLSSSSEGPAEAHTPFKGISLKDFQAQQKMIQEQNKQKKQLLQKAIEHHSKKTAAEITKIANVKNELNKMDSDLAADVAILREKIEEATIKFSNVKKSYERIEAVFLKAKLELHQAGEQKELLTEHLCTVIAYNEDRKAKKLTELMEKVGLSTFDDDDLDNGETENDGNVAN